MAPAAVQGQLTDNLGGLTDENFEGYLGPLNTGLSGTMNAAIFRTGHVPKTGVSISGGLVIMAVGYSDEDKTFVPIDPEGFSSLESTSVPTVVGSPEGVTVLGENSLSQLYPGGFDLEGFEIAAPQISIGSVFGTRALIRYIAFDLGDSDFGEFSYVGFGAQHSISQWIPDALPFDLAAGFMIQNFEIGDDLIDARATHFNVTASKEFQYFQPYVGIGIDTMELDAKYDDDDEEDPDLSFDVSLDKETDPHFTLGVAGQLPFVQAFIELNAAAATGVAVGLSFGN
jgi:hypothetical protein